MTRFAVVLTLGQAPPTPATSASHAAPAPKGWPDVVDEHATAGVVLAILGLVFFVFALAGLFVWRAGRRAKAEGREYNAFWGLSHIGALAPVPPPTSVDAPSTKGVVPGSVELFAKTSLALARVSQELGLAETESAMADREGYLLAALIAGTSDVAGTIRRASILEVRDAPDDDEAMFVRRGVPAGLFVQPHASFSKAKFELHGAGLCWAAVHACLTPSAVDTIRQRVFHAPDLTSQPSYVPHHGHHQFKSILIAPIIAGSGRNRMVLGAVCLDSEGESHYTETDQQLVAAAALALSSAWLMRGAILAYREERQAKRLART